MPHLYCISNAQTRGIYFLGKQAFRVGNRKTRLFECLETSILMLAVLMRLLWDRSELFVHTFMYLYIPEREHCLIPHLEKICSFTHSRMSVAFPDTALFAFADSAESTNVTRRSHYHPAAHSLGSANFRWIWIAQTDSGNAFRPQKFFGVIETTINFNDALKMQL